MSSHQRHDPITLRDELGIVSFDRPFRLPQARSIPGCVREGSRGGLHPVVRLLNDPKNQFVVVEVALELLAYGRRGRRSARQCQRQDDGHDGSHARRAIPSRDG